VIQQAVDRIERVLGLEAAHIRPYSAGGTHELSNGLPLLKRSLLPPFDRAFSALLEDMAARGLLEETLVVAMGEFGRTPKLGYVTSNAGAAKDGRDHWEHCYSALVFGGGVRGGPLHAGRGVGVM